MDEVVNIHTEAVLGVMEYLGELRKRSAESRVPPFMMEKVSARDEARRVSKMSKPERAAYRERVGTRHMLEVGKRIQRQEASNA